MAAPHNTPPAAATMSRFQPPPQRKRVARLMAIISPEWRGTFWVCVAGRCARGAAQKSMHELTSSYILKYRFSIDCARPARQSMTWPRSELMVHTGQKPNQLNGSSHRTWWGGLLQLITRWRRRLISCAICHPAEFQSERSSAPFRVCVWLGWRAMYIWWDDDPRYIFRELRETWKQSDKAPSSAEQYRWCALRWYGG